MKIKKAFAVFIISILLIVFIILMISSTKNIKLNTSAPAIRQMPNVVIDAGHGGEDGGAVSESGVLEKDINLAISFDTADLLTFFGFDVNMTRTSDDALTSEGETIRQRKYNDMKMRLDMYNSSENNVVISIHQNKFTSSAPKGTQVFYSPNNENSLKLAESIKYSVKSLLQPENDKECKKAESGIYLLKNSQQPAVIVECGFLSNQEECSLLITESYQKQMSFSVVTGFLDYFNTD